MTRARILWPGHPANGKVVEVIGENMTSGLASLGKLYACRVPGCPDPIIFRESQLIPIEDDHRRQSQGEEQLDLFVMPS